MLETPEFQTKLNSRLTSESLPLKLQLLLRNLALFYATITYLLTYCILLLLLLLFVVIHWVGLDWIGSGHTKWTHGQLWRPISYDNLTIILR